MMFLQRLVESRKGLSKLVGVLILIVLAVSAILIIWGPVRQLIPSPSQILPKDLNVDLSLVRACYFNGEEIKVDVKRKLDNVEIDRMRFVFSSGANAVWEVSGKRCSDIMVGGNPYGGFCEVVPPSSQKSYIFNMAGEKRAGKVGLFVQVGDDFEFVGERVVEANC